jgi:hypothetical protein
VRRAAHVVFVLGALALPEVSSGVLPGNSITLAWDASTNATVTGYKLYYGVASRNYTNSVNAGSSTTATVVGLATGVTYYFAATTYNNANVESDYSAETTFLLGGANPPTLDPITNLVVNENSGARTVNLTGISSGNTNQTKTLTVTAFSSDPTIVGNPTINYTSPNTTGSITLAPVTNAFGQVSITVMVDNGNTVSNTVIRSFTVTVNPINNPPTLDPIANVTLNENSGLKTVNLTGITSGATNEIQPLTVTAVSSNPNLIPNPTVTYTSPNTTGSLSFTPAANMFGGATITVSVSDGQPTNSTTAQSFTVTVNQVVTVQPITNIVTSPNTGIRYVIKPPATNSDQINYSLGAAAPSNARITTRKGVSSLIWTPTTAQASSTNDIPLVVTDSTTPALSTNLVVRVIVLDYVAVTVGSTSLQAGQSSSVPIYLSSSDSVTNLVFRVGWPASRFSSPTLSVTWSGVGSNSMVVQSTNLVITIASPNQPLVGSNQLARLSFQTTTNQRSSFVGLPVTIPTAVKPNALNYSNYFAGSGQVALVSDVPLLQPINTGGRSLNLFGKVGSRYQLQSTTSYGPNATWSPVLTYTQTNVAQSAVLGGSSPVIVYRLVQQ